MRGSLLLIVLFVLASPVARGDPLQHEFLLLPSADVVGTFDRRAPVTQVNDAVLKADMILSLQKGPFKLFGEYLVSNHEADLERFQLGWQMSDDTVIWVGRYHQPTSVWNHDHHHGQYLQTSITRPAIDEWEDLRGVLPQHFTGVLIESSKQVFGTWRLRTAAAGGIAPQLTSVGLEPFDLVHPDGNRHQMGYQARASLHPGDFSETGVGVLVANDQLTRIGTLPPRAFTNFDHVDLRLFALFGTYAATDWKVLSAVYYADARLNYMTAVARDSFIVGYVQFQRRLAFDFTGFVRWEDSSRAADSAYLLSFEQFARSRYVAGLRWDFQQRQALTVQLSNSHTLDGRFSDVRLQWSAALF
jgi:hypothetical protein